MAVRFAIAALGPVDRHPIATRYHVRVCADVAVEPQKEVLAAAALDLEHHVVIGGFDFVVLGDADEATGPGGTGGRAWVEVGDAVGVVPSV